MPTTDFDGSGNPNINANYYYTVEELLTKLPNNTANLIQAKDVRDSVWTLWNRIEDIEFLISSIPSVYFQNPDPTPVSVGGISAGTTFVDPTSMQDMWDKLLYPYIPPAASLSGGGLREFGGLTDITLNWSVTKKSQPITSITVDGNPIVPTGVDQSGSVLSNGNHPNTPLLSYSNTFSMSVTDSDGTVTSNSTSITWLNRIYWGKINIPGNPNLALNPGLSSSIPITSNTLTSLDGAGVGSGSSLSSSKTKSYDNINGGGDYLIFAWPSGVTGYDVPVFKVNGFLNTAFTNVKTSWLFTNQFGYDNNYEVWISNTLQNAPLFIEIS